MRRLAVSPGGRSTLSIPAQQYDLISEFILDRVSELKEITLNTLFEEAEEAIATQVGPNLGFYLIKVKQDLEQRRLIKVKRGLGLERHQLITLSKQRTHW